MSEAKLTISGGTDAGRTLTTPGHREIRPMRSRVREALFDMLAESVKEARVLDCFAGTGALGLESLSRGASFSVFVDQSPDALSCIRQNVERLGYAERVRIERADLLADRPLEPDVGTFQVAFVTPPYRYFREADSRRRLIRFLEWLAREHVVEPGGDVIVESESKMNFEHPPTGLSGGVEKRFGRTELRRFWCEGAS